MSTHDTTYPSKQVLRGLARLQCGIETEAFDNGTPEPWRSIGRGLQDVLVDQRPEALRVAVADLPGIEWDRLRRDLLEIDPVAEDENEPDPEPEDAAANQVDQSPAAKVFPLDALADPLRDFVREAAYMIGCPPDYVAVPLLASASAAIGTTVRLQIKPGWYEWPSLFTTVVAPSGAKKTPAMQCALQFVNAMSVEYDQAHENNLQNYEHKLAEYKSVVDRRKHAKNKSELPDLPDKPKRPTLRRVTIADATVEAIGKRLHENPRGLLLVRDEMASLLLGMNQYRGGCGNDEQFFLTVWNSARTTIDRKQDDDPVVLHQPFLSITGGIQPGVLPRILGRDRLEDGFTPRILFAYPDLLPCCPSDATVGEETIERVGSVFEALFKITPAQPYALPPEPQLVRLSADARARFREWEDAIGRRMDALSEEDPFRAPLAKMTGYVGRLALVLHVVKWTVKGTETIDDIDGQTMADAVELAEYFVAHAERVWRRLVESPEDKQMRQLQTWMEKKRCLVSVREIQRAGVPGLRMSHDVSATLQRMEEIGMVRHERIGRTDRYALAPYLGDQR